MIYIGVTGKAGAGKTTFTNFLSTKKNAGVIHIDEIWDKITEKYFGIFLSKNPKNQRKQPKISVKKKIYSNKITYNILMFLRDKLTRKEINKRIKEFKTKDIDIIVIEDYFLSRHKKVYILLNKIYVIEREKGSRISSIIDRDKISIEAISIMEMPYELNYEQIPIGKNVETIYNNGSLKYLKVQCENEYIKLIGKKS